MKPKKKAIYVKTGLLHSTVKPAVNKCFFHISNIMKTIEHNVLLSCTVAVSATGALLILYTCSLSLRMFCVV